MEPVDSDLGDALFEKVAEIEPALCAQISGMLLELDSTVISDLINCPGDLIKAVQKAKTAYLDYQMTVSVSVLKHSKLNNGNEASSELQELGEQIFEQVVKQHPKDAAQITGMILEMKPDQIQQVLSQEALLAETIQKAYRVLHS